MCPFKGTLPWGSAHCFILSLPEVSDDDVPILNASCWCAVLVKMDLSWTERIVTALEFRSENTAFSENIVRELRKTILWKRKHKVILPIMAVYQTVWVLLMCLSSSAYYTEVSKILCRGESNTLWITAVQHDLQVYVVKNFEITYRQKTYRRHTQIFKLQNIILY